MSLILAGVRFSVKEKLCRSLRRCRNAGVRVRYLMIINLLNGRSAYETAEVLKVHNTTVYRVARRFQAKGEWGLWDGREDNGNTNCREHYLGSCMPWFGRRRSNMVGVDRRGPASCLWKR